MLDTVDTGSGSLRAATYIRVSTEEQVEGHSLDAQRTSTRGLIARRSWTLAGEYVDAGFSAKPGAERPALDRLLDDAQAGRFDVVIVDKVDRFYRHLKGLLNALDTLNEANVSFVSVRENLDLSTPWGKLTLTVLGMLAEIYIDNLRQETRKGKRQRARKGLHNGSLPIGYCHGTCSSCTDLNGKGYCPFYGQADRGDGEVAIPHPIESVAVQLAFEWYLTGDYTDGAVAERLNEHEHTLPDGRVVHFRTKGRPGRSQPGRFSKCSVRHILQRPFYAGLIAYYGKTADGRKRKRGEYTTLYPGQHEALVDREDFDRVQAIRQRSARRSRNRRTGKPNVHPLSGLLVCSSCNRRMRATTTSSDYRYYRDVSRIEHRSACDQPTLKAEEIEAQVIGFMRHLADRLPRDWRERMERSILPPEERGEIEQREQEIEERLDRATRLHLEGHISHDQFVEEKLRAQADRADLSPAKLDAIIAAGEILESFETRWERMKTSNKQNGLLRMALAGVRVQRKSLIAVEPTIAFYPLVRLCRSGSDGIVPSIRH